MRRIFSFFTYKNPRMKVQRFLQNAGVKFTRDETTMTNDATNKHIKMMGVPSHTIENEQF
jgi:hypothetical protein